MGNTTVAIQNLLRVAGLAQIALVAGSFSIPRILKWREELDKTRPLIKQMFWTYAAYILVINFCFGLVSLICYTDITNGSRLALLVNGFIGVYWISRVLIQFLYFDRADFPAGRWNKIAEMLLVALFIFLSLVYSYAFYINFQKL